MRKRSFPTPLFLRLSFVVTVGAFAACSGNDDGGRASEDDVLLDGVIAKPPLGLDADPTLLVPRRLPYEAPPWAALPPLEEPESGYVSAFALRTTAPRAFTAPAVPAPPDPMAAPAMTNANGVNGDRPPRTDVEDHLDELAAPD